MNFLLPQLSIPTINVSGIHFAQPLALLLLLLFPIWWIVRRRRRPPAITFSRAEVLAHGPKAGGRIPKILFLLRNLVLLGLVLALARPRSAGRMPRCRCRPGTGSRDS